MAVYRIVYLAINTNTSIPQLFYLKLIVIFIKKQ